MTFPDALPHGKLVIVKNIRLGSFRSLVYLKRFFPARGPPLNFTFWKYHARRKGTGGQTSRLPYLAYPASSLFFLSFFPLAIFRLRNIKHCSVISNYFYCLCSFSLPPPPPLSPLFSHVPTPLSFPTSVSSLKHVKIFVKGNQGGERKL